MSERAEKPSGALIAVDWGTTSCRAVLLSANGECVGDSLAGPGILAVGDGAFGKTLSTMIAPLRAVAPDAPVILSGMIGSRQGWVEAPYVACPAGLAQVAAKLVQFETELSGSVYLVPGLQTRNAVDVPDVMRGEEAQVFGALALADAHSGLFVLPGTHSKWVVAEVGQLTGFRTFMTGEIFAALRDHTILGRLMKTGLADADAVQTAFADGTRAGAADGGPGALLHRVFAARTLGLFDQIKSEALSEYLSGLLIGAELAEASKGLRGPITIIGNDQLSQRYRSAAATLGLICEIAPSHCAAVGAWQIARAAGVLRRR